MTKPDSAIDKKAAGTEYGAEMAELPARFGGTEKRYILKHKNVNVLELELDDNGIISAIGKLVNEAHMPIGTVRSGRADLRELKDWWIGRSIPASREGVKEMLRSIGMICPQQLLDKSFGLSLSDQYWICPQNSSLMWQDINFFCNAFSEDVGR